MKCIINLDDMKDFRIWDAGSMGMLSSANAELLNLIREWEKDSDMLELNDLKVVQNRIRCFIHHIDFAHKVLLLHGQPVSEPNFYEQQRKDMLRQVCPCNYPITH